MKLAKKAEENATVKSGSNVLKEGIPNEHSRKHSSSKVVGANVGVTLNMQDYNSLRIDCWLTDEVQSGETHEEAYSRIIGVLDTTLKGMIEHYSNLEM